MNQADAHFAGWLMCPVRKKETRHYTKDMHESPVSKTRRIWCEDCRGVQMQFKQTNGKWEQCFHNAWLFRNGLPKATQIEKRSHQMFSDEQIHS
jgi:hypothetical protein